MFHCFMKSTYTASDLKLLTADLKGQYPCKKIIKKNRLRMGRFRICFISNGQIGEIEKIILYYFIKKKLDYYLHNTGNNWRYMKLEFIIIPSKSARKPKLDL